MHEDVWRGNGLREAHRVLAEELARLYGADDPQALSYEAGEVFGGWRAEPETAEALIEWLKARSGVESAM